MKMLIIHPTPEEGQVIRHFGRAISVDFEAGFSEGPAAVGFSDDDRDELVKGLSVMPALGHDAKVVHSLITRVLEAKEA